MQSTISVTATDTTSIANVGHVFGRLGQGEKTMPNYVGQSSFEYVDGSASRHGMMFSILPTVYSDTGL